MTSSAAELPETFEEFLAESEAVACGSCGDLIHPDYVDAGECLACRNGINGGGQA